MHQHTPEPGRNQPVRYTDQQMLLALRTVAGDDPTISQNTYELRRGHSLPASSSIRFRFGSWNQALELASLTPQPQDEQIRGVVTKWSDEDMYDAIRRCLRATGQTTKAAYEIWRASLPPEQQELVPAAITIRTRLGWADATARACREQDTPPLRGGEAS